MNELSSAVPNGNHQRSRLYDLTRVPIMDRQTEYFLLLL